MTRDAKHDPSLDHIDFPPGRWLVLEDDDVIQRGDLFLLSLEGSRGSGCGSDGFDCAWKSGRKLNQMNDIPDPVGAIALSRNRIVKDLMHRYTNKDPGVSIRKAGRTVTFGGQGEVSCPVCEKPMHYTRTVWNGHIHARCTTPGCLAWME